MPRFPLPRLAGDPFDEDATEFDPYVGDRGATHFVLDQWAPSDGADGFSTGAFGNAANASANGSLIAGVICVCPNCMSGTGHFGADIGVSVGPTGFSNASVPGPTSENYATDFTLPQIIDQLQTQWGGSQEGWTWTWAGQTITYSLPQTLPANQPSGGETYANMTVAMEARARLSFELWDDLIAPSLNDAGTSTTANITFNYGNPTSGGGTYASFWGNGSGSTYNITSAQVWCNATWSTHNSDADLYYGGYGTATYVHEIGHALGLSHPGTYNAGGGQITYTNNAEFSQDNRQYTIMSYFGGYNPSTGAWTQNGTSSSWYYGSTPMLYDIAAIQDKYGADMTTRVGDTTYGFNVTADVLNRPMFNLATYSASDRPIFAIWDAGGNDTLDFSGYSVSQLIDLNAGAFSNIGGLVGNVAIAYNCTIENCVGGSGSDTIFGNAVSNIINGGGGADAMYGGDGDDVYFVDSASDVVAENGGEGSDWVYSSINYQLTANVENLLLQGSAVRGNGNSLHNTIYGNSWNNLLDGGVGADVLLGAAGNDEYYVDDPGDIVIESAGEGSDTVYSLVHFRIGANVEDLVLQGSADLQGYGNGQSNMIYGNAGSNVIDGGADADIMYGGAGNDAYFVDSAGDLVIELSAGDGFDTVYSTAHLRLGNFVECLVLQGGGDLQGYGNDQTNVIYGNSGSNILDGGGGADAMYGGAGNDAYFVDNPGDLVIETSAGDGSDTIYSTAHLRLGDFVEYLVLLGTADLQGYGNAQSNAIYGNSGSNILDGGGGADAMYGRDGNDSYFVDDASDAVLEAANEGIDTVYSTAHFRLGANVENLILQGTANLQGYGNDEANALFGNAGSNVLNGDAGADILTGGAGNDYFQFLAGQADGDIVVDFDGIADGDRLMFIGYGAGATFTNIDATHWQVIYNDGASHDIITFSNAAAVHAGAYFFV